MTPDSLKAVAHAPYTIDSLARDVHRVDLREVAHVAAGCVLIVGAGALLAGLALVVFVWVAVRRRWIE